MMSKFDSLKTFALQCHYFHQLFIQPKVRKGVSHLQNVEWAKISRACGFAGASLTLGMILLAPPDKRMDKDMSSVGLVFYRTLCGIVVFPFAFVYFAAWPLTIPLTGYYSYTRPKNCINK